MSDAAATPPAAQDAPSAAPAADPAPKAAPAPSRARAALEAFRAKRASAPVPQTNAPATVDNAGTAPAADPAAAPAIPPDVADAAKRWQEHVKAESARISAEAEGLSDDDKALIDGEKDLARKAKLLARLKGESTDAAPVREKAKPRAAGGPPAASSVDFAAALKDPRALAEAKAKDPKGFADFFSSALSRAGRKSTLDVAPKRV